MSNLRASFAEMAVLSMITSTRTLDTNTSQTKKQVEPDEPEIKKQYIKAKRRIKKGKR